MRFLGLPVAILFLGFLAALPFRREPAAEEVPDHESEGLALPRNVTPIVENSPARTGSDDVGISRAVESEFGGMDNASQERFSSPYDLSLERLPKSYEEVAVPLMLDQRSPNLLASPTRVPANQMPVQTSQLPVQSGPQVDRFGIPRPPSSSFKPGFDGAGMVNLDGGASADWSSSDWGWSEQQAIQKIVGTTGRPSVASATVDAGNRSQQAMIDGANPTFRMASEQASSSAGRETTGDGRSSEAESKGYRAGAPNLLDRSQLPPPAAVQPSHESRPRHIIREPGL